MTQTLEQRRTMMRLLRAVRDLPDPQFEMNQWGYVNEGDHTSEDAFKPRPGCGTAVCLAGTLASLTPGFALRQSELDGFCQVVRHQDKYGYTVVSPSLHFGQLLGLSEQAAHTLFTHASLYGRDSLDEVTKRDALRVLAGCLRDGVDVLENFIRLRETQWGYITSPWVSDESLDEAVEAYCNEVGPVWEALEKA